MTRTTGKKAKRKRRDSQSSESEELTADARVLAEAVQPTEEDEQERGFLSWRKQDAEGILLLASAIKFLCARTVCRDDIKKGDEYLKCYLMLSAKVSL